MQKNENHSITEILEMVTEIMCNNYCKWPEQWDEEKEGIQLCESEICAKCPLNFL